MNKLIAVRMVSGAKVMYQIWDGVMYCGCIVIDTVRGATYTGKMGVSL